jgi:hypothetical protein
LFEFSCYFVYQATAYGAVAQLSTLGIVPHFMRTLHIIIGVALMAAFVIGCSKSSKETPTVQFVGYIDAAGNHAVGKASQATFEVKNPSESWIICAFHNQATGMPAGYPRDVFITYKPNSTNYMSLHVGQTDAETLSVTVMRMQAVSSRELSVPVP